MIRFIEEEEERMKYKNGELSNLHKILFLVRHPMPNLEQHLLKEVGFKI